MRAAPEGAWRYALDPDHSSITMLELRVEVLVFLAIADCYEEPMELSHRRDRFTATGYDRSISSDGKTGMLELHPGERILRVSASRAHYERIRVFAEDGRLVGAMSCNSDGLVQWVEPIRPA